jgi:hypothetical protein
LVKRNSELFKLRALQIGYNHKNKKMGLGDLKILFLRTTEPEELILT